MRVAADKSFTLAVVLLVASSLMANQAPDKEKLKKAASQHPSVVQIPKELALDAQQKEALAALNAEYLPRLEELKKEQESVLTAEQKQALADVKKAIKDSAKDKTELVKRLRDAVQLTDEQVKQQVEIKQKMIGLNTEIHDRFMKLLTAEQREILKQAKSELKKGSGKPLGEKKPAGEKPSSKKPAAEKPADKKPAAKKPSGEKPVDKKPASEKPTAKKPVGEKPSNEKPAAKKPAAEKPVNKKPNGEKPAAKKPAAEKPVNKKPTGEKPVEKGADKKSSGKESAEKKSDAKTPVKKVEKKGKDQPEKKQTDKK